MIHSVVLALVAVIILVLLSVNTCAAQLPEATHLFWTGGFDSTFRLCELAVEQNQTVQPIVFTGNVDGLMRGRQNAAAERASRVRILGEIRRRYPSARIYDPVEIDPVRNWIRNGVIVYDGAPVRITNGVDRLQRYGMSIGAHHRPINQYAYISQLTTDGGFVGDVCSTLDGTIQKMLVPYLDRGEISASAPSIYAPYRNMRFPTATREKRDMMEQARRGGYDDILHLTWSCWYPKKSRCKDGTLHTPCGACNMCRERLMPPPPLFVPGR